MKNKELGDYFFFFLFTISLLTNLVLSLRMSGYADSLDYADGIIDALETERDQYAHKLELVEQKTGVTYESIKP